MNQQRFMWVAVKKDGSMITEFNADGSENLYKDLPRSEITNFGLIQAQKSSYFIDLSSGAFILKDFRTDKKLEIMLPIKGKMVPICGGGGIHPFHHFKQAHQDFNAIGRQMGGTIIDKFLVGWSANKELPVVGRRFIEVTLHLDNVETPKLAFQVILRLNPSGKPIDGSPYEIVI
jgi:hypothetical protein